MKNSAKFISGMFSFSRKTRKITNRVLATVLVFALLISSNIIPVAAATQPLSVTQTFTTGSVSSFATGNSYNLDYDILTSHYSTPILNDLMMDSNYSSNTEIINGIFTVKVVKILENNTVLAEILKK